MVETFDGGLHLRYWIQNNTGAYFMAVSEEMDLSSGHDIVPNGWAKLPALATSPGLTFRYNHGRDHLVGNLTKTPIHEVRSGVVLNPVSQMQSTVKGLLARSEIRVSIVPPQFLDLCYVSLAVTQIGFLERSQMLAKTFLAQTSRTAISIAVA
jgi:hypothetical protein